MSHLDKLVAVVKSYQGQEEITPNRGFKDPDFLKKMIAVGWYVGASWCAFTAIAALKEAYADAPAIWAYLRKYASGSTRQFWFNLRSSKEVITGQIPKVGALVFWQFGNTDEGHMGIVISVGSDNKTFVSEEGNTNGQGGREGYHVWPNPHTVGLPHKEKGNNLLGFAYMPA